jgi:cell surface protein SprA
MMKNIYQIPGAYQVKQEDFRFNILYTDPSPLNYIIEAKMQLEMQCHFHLIPLR